MGGDRLMMPTNMAAEGSDKTGMAPDGAGRPKDGTVGEGGAGQGGTQTTRPPPTAAAELRNDDGQTAKSPAKSRRAPPRAAPAAVLAYAALQELRTRRDGRASSARGLHPRRDNLAARRKPAVDRALRR
jgi:hypothetical protein